VAEKRQCLRTYDGALDEPIIQDGAYGGQVCYYILVFNKFNAY